MKWFERNMKIDAPDQEVPQTAASISFLGGIFVDSQIADIEAHSKANIQYAADALQKAILRGLSMQQGMTLSIISLPFVGSFPRAYRKLYFPKAVETAFQSNPYVGPRFLNLLLIRIFARFLAAFLALARVRPKGDQHVIMVYSAHFPLMGAALLRKLFSRRIKVCVVLPDFPEFMGQGGILYKTVVLINKTVFYQLAKRVDYFVLLTKHMAERLAIGPERFTVVEGIYDPSNEQVPESFDSTTGPIFIYAGTLQHQYGIRDLLAAFTKVQEPSAQLWICGAGNAQAEVEALARQDNRVTYYGLVSRKEALRLQGLAHVMVNPRRPEGEFTRYSFPSKTMEYLASGRPVIMHWLPGIPEEYRPHLVVPPMADAEGLALAMQNMASRPSADLAAMGAAGRAFVLAEKTPQVQCAKIVSGLGSIMKRRKAK